MKNWKDFKKNHPEDFRKCCGKIYLKCKCKIKKVKEKKMNKQKLEHIKDCLLFSIMILSISMLFWA